MRCRDVEKDLLGFIDGSLDQETRRDVSDHLWTCPSCAREERRLRLANEVLGRVREGTPLPALLSATRRKIAAARLEALARGKGWMRRVWQLSPGIAVVAGGLLVVSGLLMAHSSTAGQRVRETRQVQQRIQGEGLLRQVHQIQREMPQLADQMVLANVELALREAANLDTRSLDREGIEAIQKRLASARITESLASLVRRAGGKEKEVLSRLLVAVREISKL